MLAEEANQNQVGDAIDLDNDFTVTVSDTGSVAATTLTTLDTNVPGATVTASGITTLTGSASQIAAAATENDKPPK